MKTPLLNGKRKYLLFGAAAAALILIIILIFVFSNHSKTKKENEIQGGTFITEGYEDIKDINCLNEIMSAYTNYDGKKGIIKLDGTITETASQNAIYLVSETWRSYKIAVEGPLSEYPLLVDSKTGKITKKQYNKERTPEKYPYWNDERDCLCWYGESGYIDEVESSEVVLTQGLYPVAASQSKNAKFGYIDQSLHLALAFNYEDAGEFGNKLAPVSKGGYWGYIDTTGEAIIPFQYSSADGESAFTFKDGLAPVNAGGRYGLINTKGETVVNFNFEKIIQGSNGKYMAKKDGVWGLLTVSKDLRTAAKKLAPEESTVPNGSNYIVSTAGSELNIRAEASASAEKVGAIPNGTAITVTQVTDGWAYTTYGSVSGWVSAAYLKQITEDSAAVVTTAGSGEQQE